MWHTKQKVMPTYASIVYENASTRKIEKLLIIEIINHTKCIPFNILLFSFEILFLSSEFTINKIFLNLNYPSYLIYPLSGWYNDIQQL